jgi:hypothetical protein
MVNRAPIAGVHDPAIGKLRWGACDLGAGSSGDTHHFDLGFHPPDYQPVK